MRLKVKLALLPIILAVFSPVAYGDGILISWAPRDVQGITEQSFNAAKQLTVAEISKKNLEVKSWADAFLLMVAARQHKDDPALRAELVSQLSNSTKIVLKGASRLIIWERITAGEIQFEGKGYQTNDDLFSVAGRANWILRSLTNLNFGYVKAVTSEKELNSLQQRWETALASHGVKVSTYEDPYATPVTGLEEIRSLEALEALIISLAPTQLKGDLTKACLMRLYQMEKLPEDQDSPASLCNPDQYTSSYLRVLTGVTEKHDYDWWKKWWNSNKNQLKWNKEKGSFNLSKQ